MRWSSCLVQFSDQLRGVQETDWRSSVYTTKGLGPGVQNHLVVQRRRG
jgi:hypothetical protein